MLALRYAYILALSVWLGGMVVLSVFHLAAPQFSWLALSCGATLVVTLILMGVLGPRPAGFAIRLGLVVLMVAVAAYAHLLTPADSPPSYGTMRVNLLAALVLLVFEAREHAR